MKVFKITTLILMLVLAMIVPVFAESESAGTAEDQPLLYNEEEEGEGIDGTSGEDRDAVDYPNRTELQINTDLFVFSREVQEQMAAKDIKVIYTAALNEEKVEVGVYPDKVAAREVVLNLLVENNIGEEKDFEIVHSEEISTMPISADDPSSGPPDAIKDPDIPVSNKEAEEQISDITVDPSDTEEDYVRPDDENAEMGITSVDDSEVDSEEENREEDSINYILSTAAVIGLAAIAAGVFYFKR